MPRPPAAALRLSARQREEVLKVSNHRSTPQSMVLRAKIVLGASKGRSNHGLARELGTSVPTVLLWRRRFETEGVAGILQDLPRSGRPKRITPEQEAAIVESTLRTQPKNATQWSVRMMARVHCRLLWG